MINGSRELPPLELEVETDDVKITSDEDLKSQMMELVKTTSGTIAPAYTIPRYTVAIGSDLLETSPIGHRQLLSEIIQAEGPIHQDEISNRVAQTYGLSHAGRRIRTHIEKALSSLLRGGATDVVKEGEFYMTQAQLHNTPVRSRASVTGSIAKVEFIAPSEIRAAAKAVIEENGELDSDTLTKAVSDYFGFKRLGPALKIGIDEALKTLFN